MDMPNTLKQYVHRVGRTARAGRVGRSISLVGESERKLLKEIVASNKGGSLKQRLISSSQFFNLFKFHFRIFLAFSGFLEVFTVFLSSFNTAQLFSSANRGNKFSLLQM